MTGWLEVEDQLPPCDNFQPSTMQPTRKFVVLCLGLGLALVSTVASAALPGRPSWRQVSDDGRYVLVMVSPLSVDEDLEHDGVDADEIRSIRATYFQSGLYLNDATTTLVWTVPYHDTTHQAFIGPQGQYLVLAHEDWYGWSGHFGHVATFYSSGTELASHLDTDLFSLLYLSLPFLARVDGDGVSFDARALTFTTHTTQGDTIVFDVTNGQIIRQTSPIFKSIGVVIVGLLVAAVILALLMRRQQKGVRSEAR